MYSFNLKFLFNQFHSIFYFKRNYNCKSIHCPFCNRVYGITIYHIFFDSRILTSIVKMYKISALACLSVIYPYLSIKREYTYTCVGYCLCWINSTHTPFRSNTIGRKLYRCIIKYEFVYPLRFVGN